jgi:rhodanese-related sulfurtransferase
MKLFVSLTAILVFSLAACHPKAAGERAQEGPAAAAPSDGVRRVTVAELNEALGKGEAVAVDVRGSVDYDLGHIKGARSVPLGLIAEQADELPRDKLLVTYCACTHEQLSVRAVEELKKHGIENAAALLGGWDEWQRAGLPTE